MDFIWGFMIQLGHNMWYEPGDGPGLGKGGTLSEPRNRTEQQVWDAVTECAARKGANLMVIDLGEGLIYPSHPELAVAGSWTPEKLKKELARLRRLGLEPVPKLNFSAKHDAWLKQYSRMVSTETYYKVCADLIADVCGIFDHPRYFHLGWDEERTGAQRKCQLLVTRQGDLWWHDMLFTAREVERHGARPWVWSDKNWVCRAEFKERMPKSILQSNCWYNRLKNFVRNDEEIAKRDWPGGWGASCSFLELEEDGHDQVPCGSNVEDMDESFLALTRLAKVRIAPERLKGFLMAPWSCTYGKEPLKKQLEACDILERAITEWNEDRLDVVIYGATQKGIDAAIKARRTFHEPILIDPAGDQAVLNDWQIRNNGVLVKSGERLDRSRGSVAVENGKIVSIRMENGNVYRARTFIDGTENGELIAAMKGR